MKTLVVLAAFVVLVTADEAINTADLQECINQAVGFKKCIEQRVNESKNIVFAGVKEALTKACFKNSPCKFPDISPDGFPPQAAAETPSPSATQCFGGAKRALFTCLKNELHIPDGFKPQFDSDFKQPKRPPFFHGHQNQSEAFNEIHKIVLGACDNNQTAAEELENCAKNFFGAQFSGQKKPPPPIAFACKAGFECSKTNKFSDKCRDILARGGKAFCGCKHEIPDFIKTNDACADVRSHFKEHHSQEQVAHEHSVSASAPFTDHPHDAGVPFDFCNGNGVAPFEVCKKILAELDSSQGRQ